MLFFQQAGNCRRGVTFCWSCNGPCFSRKYHIAEYIQIFERPSMLSCSMIIIGHQSCSRSTASSVSFHFCSCYSSTRSCLLLCFTICHSLFEWCVTGAADFFGVAPLWNCSAASQITALSDSLLVLFDPPCMTHVVSQRELLDRVTVPNHPALCSDEHTPQNSFTSRSCKCFHLTRESLRHTIYFPRPSWQVARHINHCRTTFQPLKSRQNVMHSDIF